MCLFYIKVMILCSLGCSIVLTFKTYTALNSVVFLNMETLPTDEFVKSEYFYGRCFDKDKILVQRDRYNYSEIKGRSMIMIPVNTLYTVSCAHVRSLSAFEDRVTYHSREFSLCISWVRYKYNYRYGRADFQFYTWYIPNIAREGIDWEIYIYRAK